MPVNILEGWFEIMHNYPFNNLYQIIDNNAKSAPNRIIIFEKDLKISNQKFKQHVDYISEFLYQQGIRRKDKVALVMANSWQFIANIFAISRIGAIIVPINNFLKEHEISYILNDAQAKLLFASAKFAPNTKNVLLNTNVEKIVWVEGIPLENERNIDYAKIPYNTEITSKLYSSNLEDTAIIVYTSGTTGKPKGAMLSFKNIISNCQACKSLMKLNNGQLKLLCYLPMFHAFTLTVNVILPIYANSGVIVIRSISTIKDFKYLLKQLLWHRCRFFTGVPDIYSAMAKAKLPWYFHYLHNVRGFISGASALPKEVQHNFAKSFKRGKLLEGYGISECSPVVSCNTPEAYRLGSVGRPLLDYQVQIFDEHMHELPTGEIGEICVKGDNVMQGYYNRPKETEEAIVNGWFKTGDIGYIDSDGFIFIIDRIKDIIINKGMNIYPREIEDLLYTHAKINACAVVGVKEKNLEEVPIAYIELKEGESATEEEIKSFLSPSLATFKIPKRIFFTTELPRNATGKILKRELRAQANK